MVMVSPGGEEGRRAQVHKQVEAHKVAVKPDGAVQVGHLEMYVPDARSGRKRGQCGSFLVSVVEVCLPLPISPELSWSRTMPERPKPEGYNEARAFRVCSSTVAYAAAM